MSTTSIHGAPISAMPCREHLCTSMTSPNLSFCPQLPVTLPPSGCDCPVFSFLRLCSLWCCYKQCWKPGGGEGCGKEKDMMRLRRKVGNSVFAVACQQQVRAQCGQGTEGWCGRWIYLWSRALGTQWGSLWVNWLLTTVKVSYSI